MPATETRNPVDDPTAGRTGTSEPGDEQKAAEFREEAIPHLDAVYRFALRLARSESDAEDLVQETYVRAWRSWDQYTLGTQCRSWLFTICRNLFVRTRNREKRHDELLRENSPTHRAFPLKRDPAFSASKSDDPEGSFFDDMVDDTILDAIDELPDPYRQAVRLSDLEGLAYQEVADVLDVPVGTVKSRLFRGRKLLQEKLYDYALSMGYVGPDDGDEEAGDRPEAPARTAPSAPPSVPVTDPSRGRSGLFGEGILDAVPT